MPVEVSTALVMKHGMAVKLLYLDLIQKLTWKIFFFWLFIPVQECIALFCKATNNFLINSFRNNSKFLTSETLEHELNFFLPLKKSIMASNCIYEETYHIYFRQRICLALSMEAVHYPLTCSL